MNELQKRIEFLAPSNQEKWNVTCSLYLGKKTQSSDTKELFLLSFGDKPKKIYLLLKSLILESDKDMIPIIDRLKMYQIRQTVSIVVRKQMIRVLISS